MISRIIKVEVRVLTETLVIILGITKTESNNCLIILKRKNMATTFTCHKPGRRFASSPTANHKKRANLT